MRGLKLWLYTIFAGFLVGIMTGCGSDDTLGTGPNDPGDPGNPGDPVPATVILLTSDPQLPSDGSQDATITAIVRDSNNAAIAGENVVFSVDSGTILATQPLTDSTGTALATLSIGTTAADKANRTINVTATAGSASSSVTVDVQGTQITISGANSLTFGDSTDYFFTASDASNNGISGITLAPMSALGNPVSSSDLTTDASGQVQATLTASVPIPPGGSSDTLSVIALGTSASLGIAISGDQFSFTSPLASTEVDLGVSQTVTVQWLKSGVPETGRSVAFSSTRGTLAGANPATTDGSGNATVSISSLDAGVGLITATVIDGVTTDRPTTSRQLEFVATTPDSIEVQSDRFNISENEQATLTASVFDATGNRVKNAVINFSLVDTSNGSLSVGTALTDSNGQASTVYQAGTVTSGTEDVVITASVLGFPALTDSVGITVAQREVFITLGFDNELQEIEPADYQIDFSVRALDSTGAALANANIDMSIESVEYNKGLWANCGEDGDSWFLLVTAEACPDEDVNRDGSLQPAEDYNGSGFIEAGGVAAVFPGRVQTDADGRGIASIIYGQNYGGWLTIRVKAKTDVQGTEFEEVATFILGVLAEDTDDINISPPGFPINIPASSAPMLSACPDGMGGFLPPTTLSGLQVVSPFGYGSSCNDWLL
ncbi:MAG: Ig-like domain-containing protein [Gammaproteobacteria bacterium]|nr:Ig-like domain-containing protein [Gammaproteobacteria bacterium]